MCGILGVKEFNKKVERNSIEKMIRVQNHRGPDANGIYLDTNLALGHNRLSIIDLSEYGNQPMFSNDNSLVLVFNGEIYNYKKLRQDLVQKGHSFRSNTDSEVLLYAYKEYGSEMLSMLNGMFAFCIYDKRNESIFIARDRFGQKPLYYYFDDNKFVFSSELKTICSYPDIDLSIDFDAIDLFLSLQYIPAPHTIYKKIKMLNASSYLYLENNSFQITRYYDVKVNTDYAKLSYEDAKVLLREKVENAVKTRMMSDVPLGTFLSGGIDSSIVTSVMAQASTKPINTISVGFEEREFSELDKARALSEKYKTNHHEFILKMDDAKQNIERIISYYDQPYADSSAIPTYFLSKVAKQQITVALAGDGGDEVFCGYQRYFLDMKFRKIENVIPSQILKTLSNPLQLIPPLKNVPVEKNWLLGLNRLSQVFSIDHKASILRWGSFFDFQKKHKLYRNYPYKQDEAVRYISEIFKSRSDFKDFTQNTQYADLISYTPGDYLVKTDIASMQHALEVRCPLLDFELVDFAFSIPPEYHRNNNKGKRIFTDAFSSDLPIEVKSAAKSGFSIPVNKWFREQWADILIDYISSDNSFSRQHFNIEYINKLLSQHKNGTNDHSKRLFTLLSLEIWFQNSKKRI